jgi:hypothetical protein
MLVRWIWVPSHKSFLKIMYRIPQKRKNVNPFAHNAHVEGNKNFKFKTKIGPLDDGHMIHFGHKQAAHMPNFCVGR